LSGYAQPLTPDGKPHLIGPGFGAAAAELRFIRKTAAPMTASRTKPTPKLTGQRVRRMLTIIDTSVILLHA
jgi:hypothetical protein